ncbi:hypothetical protein vseg_015959 [Gypsophila vaccaria]
MASQTILRHHLRRAISLSTSILPHHHRHVTTLLHPLPVTHTTTTTPTTTVPNRSFHSSRLASFSAASRSFNDIEKIDPDTILFEGCDYRHWLIVMDFGKDPNQRPPPDGMVETYVQTCAQVVGSVEEAKKKIYACSTTTYTGFQVEVDEETSKKFEGLPGVIFVLPDSYIDPVNKEYGGDKYINGQIIPRPPPVQYGRENRGFRSNGQGPRNSMPNQQGNRGYNPQGNPGYNQQENPGYNQQSSMSRGGRSYAPPGQQQGFPQQQNFPPQQTYSPQQNYGPSGQADRGMSPGGNQYSGVGTDMYRGSQRNLPPQQGNYNNGYNHPQGQMSNVTGSYGSSAPPGQHLQGPRDHGYSHPQGPRGNFPVEHGGYAPPGPMGTPGINRTNFSSPVTGADGQAGAGSFQQSGAGQGPNPSSFGHGAGYAPRGEDQMFQPASNAQSNPMGPGHYPPGTQTTFNQGRPSEISYGHGAGYTSHGEQQRFPPASYEQSNSTGNGNYPPGTQPGFNQGRY